MHFPSCILVKIMLYCLSAFEMPIAEAQSKWLSAVLCHQSAFRVIRMLSPKYKRFNDLTQNLRESENVMECDIAQLVKRGKLVSPANHTRGISAVARTR